MIEYATLLSGDGQLIIIAQEHVYLLELIKSVLFNQKPVLVEDVNWEKIFETAKLHCIVPLLVSCVPKYQRSDWNAVLYQSKARYMQMIYEQNLLVQLFKNNDIPYVILKGTAAAIYYPNPTLRTYGDIDIYVSKNSIKSANDLIERSGYRFISNTVREYEFEKNGIVFELHSKFSSKHYNNIEHVFINGLNNSVEYHISNCSFKGLPTYENGLVLLGHIMQHLKATGIGLRQIIDWMMFVHQELDDSAWNNHFRELALEAGLEKLAITVTYMCKKWLGLPNDITWCNTADEDVADQLLLRVLNDGNFGCDRAPFENIRLSIKNDGLFKHLQRTGLENWSSAQKHKVLRPFAWLFQMLRYAGLGIAGLFTGKKIFRKDKQNLKLEELWKSLE